MGHGASGIGHRAWGSKNTCLLPLANRVLLVILGVLLMGCSSPPVTSPTASGSLEVVNSGQTLPVSAQAKVREQTIGLEVARTPQQQEIGLMYRASLGENRGMLFPFEPPQPVKFWMKHTLIPLDMIFLQHGVVKAIAAATPPCTTQSCTTYGPATPIDQVIELHSGRAAALGLKVGDQVKIQFLDSMQSK